MKKKVVFLTGAGISAESGLKTFRDADGLWEGHDIEEVATPQGYRKNPSLVLDFYNQRRRQLLTVSPNLAHKLIVSFEQKYDVCIITQNVDDLHERAGSSNVLHLHGELLKSCNDDKSKVYDCSSDIKIGDKNNEGSQLRPFIVWFNEDVPLLNKAIDIVAKADILIVIGTSLLVYPAASLMDYANANCILYYIDKNPSYVNSNVNVISNIASKGMLELAKALNINA